MSFESAYFAAAPGSVESEQLMYTRALTPGARGVELADPTRRAAQNVLAMGIAVPIAALPSLNIASGELTIEIPRLRTQFRRYSSLCAANDQSTKNAGRGSGNSPPSCGAPR